MPFLKGMEQKHSIPLTQAVNASTPGRGALAESLYAEAENTLLNRVPATQPPGRVARTRQVIPLAGDLQHVMATATDEETGLFVQLGGVLNPKLKPLKLAEGPFLTYGKKYLMETKSPQLANNAIKIWR